jgi:hypothetical protein
MIELRKKFNWVESDFTTGISDAYIHELLNEPVTRCCVAIKYAKDILERDAFVCHRLFGLNTGTSVLYTTDLYSGPQPNGIPDSVFVFAETNHYAEFNRPTTDLMTGYKEYFFTAPIGIIYALGINTEGVNESTVYSAIHYNNEVVAFRRYTNYDDEDTTSTLANWSLLVILAARKAKRNDIIKKLLAFEQ